MFPGGPGWSRAGPGRSWAGPGGFFRVRGAEKIIKNHHLPNFRTFFFFSFFWPAWEPGSRHRARELGRTGKNRKTKIRKFSPELPARPAGPEYGISVLRVLLSLIKPLVSPLKGLLSPAWDAAPEMHCSDNCQESNSEFRFLTDVQTVHFWACNV